jgi:hypothetical protein
MSRYNDIDALDVRKLSPIQISDVEQERTRLANMKTRIANRCRRQPEDHQYDMATMILMTIPKYIKTDSWISSTTGERKWRDVWTHPVMFDEDILRRELVNRELRPETKILYTKVLSICMMYNRWMEHGELARYRILYDMIKGGELSEKEWKKVND